MPQLFLSLVEYIRDSTIKVFNYIQDCTNAVPEDCKLNCSKNVCIYKTNKCTFDIRSNTVFVYCCMFLRNSAIFSKFIHQ